MWQNEVNCLELNEVMFDDSEKEKEIKGGFSD